MTDDKQRKIFAENLTRYINQSGKTQIEIAKELGYGKTTFNNWCKGVAIPTAGKIRRLADYFHIGMSDLTDIKDERYSDEVTHLYSKIRNDKEMCDFLVEYYKSDKNAQDRLLAYLKMLTTDIK